MSQKDDLADRRRAERTERSFLTRWWLWIVGMIVIAMIVLGIAGYAGLFGRTIAERFIFENSFQYSEGRKKQISIYEAQLAEVESRLLTLGDDNDPSLRADLESQRSMLRVQINAARNQ